MDYRHILAPKGIAGARSIFIPAMPDTHGIQLSQWHPVVTYSIWSSTAPGIHPCQPVTTHGIRLSPTSSGCHPQQPKVTHNWLPRVTTSCHPWHWVVTCGIWLLQWHPAVKHGNRLSPMAFGCHLWHLVVTHGNQQSLMATGFHPWHSVVHLWHLVVTHGNQQSPMATGCHPWHLVVTHGHNHSSMATGCKPWHLVVALGNQY